MFRSMGFGGIKGRAGAVGQMLVMSPGEPRVPGVDDELLKRQCKPGLRPMCPVSPRKAFLPLPPGRAARVFC